MVLLTCQLVFESSTGKPILHSSVYDTQNDRFVKITQKISHELAQDLSANNPMCDIHDIISLDYIDYLIEGDELEDIFEMIGDGPDNAITYKAKNFILQYKRNKKITTIINEKD